MSYLVDEYARKRPEYFAGARNDIVARMQTGPESRVLELGCGAGATGRAVLQAGKAGHYLGIEFDPSAAGLAEQHLTQVMVGDVHQLDVQAMHGTFDALIMSEVLEHLVDPWSVAQKLVACLKPGGAVFASSPNVTHWKVIAGLLAGRFEYTPEGVMDRTHLRWFSPSSFRALFEGAGVEVESLEPVDPFRPKAMAAHWLTGKRYPYLFMDQIMVTGRRR